MQERVRVTGMKGREDDGNALCMCMDGVEVRMLVKHLNSGYFEFIQRQRKLVLLVEETNDADILRRSGDRVHSYSVGCWGQTWSPVQAVTCSPSEL